MDELVITLRSKSFFTICKEYHYKGSIFHKAETGADGISKETEPLINLHLELNRK
jgi:hypothetical protein